MANPDPGNPIQVQNYLGGVDYPVNKDQLVEAAESNGAPDAVLETLRQLPSSEYKQPTDVTRAVSNQDPSKRRG